MLKKKYCCRESFIQPYEETFKDELKGVTRPDRLKKEHVQLSSSTIPMFYLMKKCNELKNNYEKEHCFIYDIVINARPDLLFFRPLKYDELQQTLTFNIRVHGCCLGYPVTMTDNFAIGTSEQRTKYLTCFDSLSTYFERLYKTGVNKDINGVLINESLLSTHCQHMNVSVNHLEKNYILYRFILN